MKRRALGVATSLVATVVLVGCSSESAKSSGSTHQDELLGHVHGLGTDPADGTLYVASHMGVFRRQDDGRLERVGDRWQDTMAFTVVGPGHWSVPDFSECGLGCDSCECAMSFVPFGWGEVSQV